MTMKSHLVATALFSTMVMCLTAEPNTILSQKSSYLSTTLPYISSNKDVESSLPPHTPFHSQKSVEEQIEKVPRRLTGTPEGSTPNAPSPTAKKPSNKENMRTIYIEYERSVWSKHFKAVHLSTPESSTNQITLHYDKTIPNAYNALQHTIIWDGVPCPSFTLCSSSPIKRTYFYNDLLSDDPYLINSFEKIILSSHLAHKWTQKYRLLSHIKSIHESAKQHWKSKRMAHIKIYSSPTLATDIHEALAKNKREALDSPEAKPPTIPELLRKINAEVNAPFLSISERCRHPSKDANCPSFSVLKDSYGDIVGLASPTGEILWKAEVDFILKSALRDKGVKGVPTIDEYWGLKLEEINRAVLWTESAQRESRVAVAADLSSSRVTQDEGVGPRDDGEAEPVAERKKSESPKKKGGKAVKKKKKSEGKSPLKNGKGKEGEKGNTGPEDRVPSEGKGRRLAGENSPDGDAKESPAVIDKNLQYIKNLGDTPPPFLGHLPMSTLLDSVSSRSSFGSQNNHVGQGYDGRLLPYNLEQTVITSDEINSINESEIKAIHEGFREKYATLMSFETHELTVPHRLPQPAAFLLFTGTAFLPLQQGFSYTVAPYPLEGQERIDYQKDKSRGKTLSVDDAGTGVWRIDEDYALLALHHHLDLKETIVINSRVYMTDGRTQRVFFLHPQHRVISERTSVIPFTFDVTVHYIMERGKGEEREWREKERVEEDRLATRGQVIEKNKQYAPLRESIRRFIEENDIESAVEQFIKLHRKISPLVEEEPKRFNNNIPTLARREPPARQGQAGGEGAGQAGGEGAREAGGEGAGEAVVGEAVAGGEGVARGVNAPRGSSKTDVVEAMKRVKKENLPLWLLSRLQEMEDEELKEDSRSLNQREEYMADRAYYKSLLERRERDKGVVVIIPSLSQQGFALSYENKVNDTPFLYFTGGESDEQALKQFAAWSSNTAWNNPRSVKMAYTIGFSSAILSGISLIGGIVFHVLFLMKHSQKKKSRFEQVQPLLEPSPDREGEETGEGEQTGEGEKTGEGEETGEGREKGKGDTEE